MSGHTAATAPDGASDLPRDYSDVETLSLLSATWRTNDPTAMIEDVLAKLVDMLGLACASLRLSETPHIHHRTREPQDRAMQGAVRSWLEYDPQPGSTNIRVAGTTYCAVSLPLGEISSMGLLVAVSSQAGFPRATDLLKLRIAASQTSLAIRELREVNERREPTSTQPGTSSGQALAESEWRLNLIINTIPAMVWSATPDGMVDLLNQYFLDFVGLPAEQVLGTGFHRAFHPDDVSGLLSTWQAIMETKCSQEIEGRILCADGSHRWFLFRQNPLLDAEGNVVKWYGVILDIEDRKRAEIALQEAQLALSASERNLRLIIDSLPVLAWGARPDGSSDFVNRGWAEYAGVGSEKILEWGFLNFYHPDDVPGMVEIWKDALATKDRMGLKGRIRRHDGEYRWFYFAGQKITDANGVVRWIGANVDIEDLQRAEEKLRQSQAELARVARVTTLGELAVSIAHEVNQPLTGIVASAGTCLRWLDPAQFDSAQARLAAERVIRDGHRAGEIIANIRALASKSPIQMEPMDVQDAIRDVLTVLNGEFRRRCIQSSFDPEEAAVIVRGDRTQLQQVILNLVMNALEAMTESEPRRLTIVSVADGNSFARVSVSDTGSGLGSGVADRVFEAFLSTKPGGLGMGLSICRSIIEAHGGSISSSGNTTRGSTFSFTVPMAPTEVRR